MHKNWNGMVGLLKNKTKSIFYMPSLAFISDSMSISGSAGEHSHK
jgi:hypothetical protein